MKVYLDTSVAINDDFLQSSMAVSFLRASKLLGISVTIPEIVIDEIKGRYRSTLSDRAIKYKKAAKAIMDIADIELKEIDIDEMTAQYSEWLDDILDKYDIDVLPYPDVSIKEIVIASYRKKKPYKDSGDGHKDYVIWSSISKSINQNHLESENFFLTNNTKDFCDQIEGAFILHPDIACQINRASAIPVVVTHIKAFFDEKIKPELKDIDLAELPDLNIDVITNETLVKDLGGYEAFGFEGIPFSNQVYLTMISDSSIENIEIKKIDDDEIMITVEGFVGIEADGFMDKANYLTSSEFEQRSIYVADADWNDHVMSVSASTETPFELSFSYSKEAGEITDHTLVLPGEIESGHW